MRSPRCCTACGSLAIKIEPGIHTCERCGATRKRMPFLHAVGKMRPNTAFTNLLTIGPDGMSGVAYMKRKIMGGQDG